MTREKDKGKDKTAFTLITWWDIGGNRANSYKARKIKTESLQSERLIKKSERKQNQHVGWHANFFKKAIAEAVHENLWLLSAGVMQRTKHVPVSRSYRKGSVTQGSGHCFANLCRTPHITIVAVRKFGHKSTVNCRNKIPRKSKPRYITGSWFCTSGRISRWKEPTFWDFITWKKLWKLTVKIQWLKTHLKNRSLHFPRNISACTVRTKGVWTVIHRWYYVWWWGFCAEKQP